MSKLAELRTNLAALRRRRRSLRRGAAWCGLALAGLWILAGGFLIDWQLELDRWQRVVLWAGMLGLLTWSYRRFAAPFLGVRETELDMALLVEREQKIDSDLSAALQFESPAASRWGSSQLSGAVIDYVADYGKELNVFTGLSRQPFQRRATLMGLTLLAGAGLSAAFPGHATAFWKRLGLSAVHYPTRTIIERIDIAGKRAFPADAASARTIKSAYWEPLQFEVHAKGELPLAGKVELTGERGGINTAVTLLPDKSRSGVFAGQLDRLVDSVTWQAFLGDDWTDPQFVQVIPLAVVDVQLKVAAPDYARASDANEEISPGSRQISVVEGSRVDVSLSSDKPLAAAELTIAAKKFLLVKGDDDRWRLPEDTPLARVVEPLKYEIQIVDRDGLSLKDSVQGFIRIKADRPPRVSAAVVTQHVLPAAKPNVSFGAADDYGIGRLVLHRQVVRVDGTMSEDAIEVPLSPSQAGESQKLVRGKLPVDLAPLKLMKGDQLKVTFEAIDYRGSLPGRATLSEPLLLHVTDERGVLAAMIESDERSARQLDAIIERQLGIGESP